MNKNYESQIKAMLSNPCASDWLKAAAVKLDSRDCVDAMNDVAKLYRLMRLKMKEVFGAEINP